MDSMSLNGFRALDNIPPRSRRAVTDGSFDRCSWRLAILFESVCLKRMLNHDTRWESGLSKNTYFSS